MADVVHYTELIFLYLEQAALSGPLLGFLLNECSIFEYADNEDRMDLKNFGRLGRMIVTNPKAEVQMLCTLTESCKCDKGYFNTTLSILEILTDVKISIILDGLRPLSEYYTLLGEMKEEIRVELIKAKEEMCLQFTEFVVEKLVQLNKPEKEVHAPLSKTENADAVQIRAIQERLQRSRLARKCEESEEARIQLCKAIQRTSEQYRKSMRENLVQLSKAKEKASAQYNKAMEHACGQLSKAVEEEREREKKAIEEIEELMSDAESKLIKAIIKAEKKSGVSLLSRSQTFVESCGEIKDILAQLSRSLKEILIQDGIVMDEIRAQFSE